MTWMIINEKKWKKWINEWMNMQWGVSIYRFDGDLKKICEFKILDTSFEGLCLKTPNITLEIGYVF